MITYETLAKKKIYFCRSKQKKKLAKSLQSSVNLFLEKIDTKMYEEIVIHIALAS